MDVTELSYSAREPHAPSSFTAFGSGNLTVARDGGGSRVQCAALPWRRGPHGVEVLLITSRETRRWVIPRGGREPLESPSKAAAREAFEEAGVKGKVRRLPIGVYEFDKRLKGGRLQRVLVTVYPLAVKRELHIWPEKRERERQWMEPKAAAASVDEPELKAMIAQFNPEKR